MSFIRADLLTFSAVDQGGDMLKHFEESSSLHKLSDVTTFENVDGLEGKTMMVESADGTPINARFQGDTWRTYVYHPFQVKVGAWSRTYGLYSSIGVKINSEEYKRGDTFLTRKLRWRNESAKYLYCGGYARTQVCGGGTCSPVLDTPNSWNTRSNKHRAEKTLAEAAGVGMWHVTQFVAGYYEVEFDNGFRTSLSVTFE